MPDPTGLQKGNNDTVTAVGAGTSITDDVFAGNNDTLVVQVDMDGTSVSDLVVTVTPYLGNNTTLGTAKLPVVQSAGPTLAGGRMSYYAQFDVQGLERVQIKITNNNAAQQNVNHRSWRLG